MKNSNDIFPERLKISRLRLNMSQKELAEKVGVTLKTITRYETGESRPKFSNMISLSNALHVTPAYLVGDTAKPDESFPS